MVKHWDDIIAPILVNFFVLLWVLYKGYISQYEVLTTFAKGTIMFAIIWGAIVLPMWIGKKCNLL